MGHVAGLADCRELSPRRDLEAPALESDRGARDLAQVRPGLHLQRNMSVRPESGWQHHLRIGTPFSPHTAQLRAGNAKRVRIAAAREDDSQRAAGEMNL